jgi:hypothetical protein
MSVRVTLAGVGGAVDEGHVQLGVGGRAGQGRSGVVAEPDAHLGVRAAEAGQQRRQVDHAEGLDRSDVQRAAQHTADSGDRVASLVGRAERPPRCRQQRPSGLGECHVAAVADEQPGAHLAFERVDRRAQARLDHVDPGRGPGEVQLLGHGHEMGQLTQLHQSMISMLISESRCWTDACSPPTLKRRPTAKPKEKSGHVLNTQGPAIPAGAGARGNGRAP